MRRLIIFLILLLGLAGCTSHNAIPHSDYCKPIIRALHGGAHRHTMGSRITATKKVNLYKEAQLYNCDTRY